jgi:DNA-binding MarR family transcriptional regulator
MAAMVESQSPQSRARARSVLQSLDLMSRLLTASCYRHGLNPAQWSALRYFSEAAAKDCTPSAFARAHRATKGTISQTLMALTRKGLIEKITDARDGRSITVKLTATGTALLAQDPWRAFEDVLMKGPEDSIRQVARIADLLAQAIARDDA